MIFRRATPADATDLHALRRCSILELAPEGMPITLARQWAEKGSVESTSKRLQDTEVWVAELDDQIVGWIAVRGNDYLDALYVAPEHTKRGIGTDLLKLVEAELRARASMRFAQTRVGIRRPSIFIEATSPSGHAQLMTLARCESALSAVLANSKWSRRA